MLFQASLILPMSHLPTERIKNLGKVEKITLCRNFLTFHCVLHAADYLFTAKLLSSQGNISIDGRTDRWTDGQTDMY